MKRIGAILFLVLAVAVSSWAQRSPFKVSEHDTATARVLRNSAPIGLYADSSAFADSSRVADTCLNCPVIDTTSLSNRIDEKVATADSGVVYVTPTDLAAAVGVPDTIHGNKVFPDTLTVGVLIETWPKKYIANLTQSSADPPTARVFVNTAGFGSWSYKTQGLYYLEVPGNPDPSDVWVTHILSTGSASGKSVLLGAFAEATVVAYDFGEGEVTAVQIEAGFGGARADGLLNDSSIEIRIYPPLP
jgi:hypothetical protein